MAQPPDMATPNPRRIRSRSLSSMPTTAAGRYHFRDRLYHRHLVLESLNNVSDGRQQDAIATEVFISSLAINDDSVLSQQEDPSKSHTSNKLTDASGSHYYFRALATGLPKELNHLAVESSSISQVTAASTRFHQDGQSIGLFLLPQIRIRDSDGKMHIVSILQRVLELSNLAIDIALATQPSFMHAFLSNRWGKMPSRPDRKICTALIKLYASLSADLLRLLSWKKEEAVQKMGRRSNARVKNASEGDQVASHPGVVVPAIMPVPEAAKKKKKKTKSKNQAGKNPSAQASDDQTVMTNDRAPKPPPQQTASKNGQRHNQQVKRRQTTGSAGHGAVISSTGVSAATVSPLAQESGPSGHPQYGQYPNDIYPPLNAHPAPVVAGQRNNATSLPRYQASNLPQHYNNSFHIPAVPPTNYHYHVARTSFPSPTPNSRQASGSYQYGPKQNISTVNLGANRTSSATLNSSNDSPTSASLQPSRATGWEGYSSYRPGLATQLPPQQPRASSFSANNRSFSAAAGAYGSVGGSYGSTTTTAYAGSGYHHGQQAVKYGTNWPKYPPRGHAGQFRSRGGSRNDRGAGRGRSFSTHDSGPGQQLYGNNREDRAFSATVVNNNTTNDAGTERTARDFFEDAPRERVNGYNYGHAYASNGSNVAPNGYNHGYPGDVSGVNGVNGLVSGAHYHQGVNYTTTNNNDLQFPNGPATQATTNSQGNVSDGGRNHEQRGQQPRGGKRGGNAGNRDRGRGNGRGRGRGRGRGGKRGGAAGGHEDQEGEADNEIPVNASVPVKM